MEGSKILRIVYDPLAQALYIDTFRKEVHKHTEELEEGLLIDKDEKDQITGVEILNVASVSFIVNNGSKEISSKC